MGPKNLKVVMSDDWQVIYSDNGDKIWEGHGCDTNALLAVAEYFGYGLQNFSFTDEDEIDGCTPDHFNNIRGISSCV